jgi:hypothetical protein
VKYRKDMLLGIEIFRLSHLSNLLFTFSLLFVDFFSFLLEVGVLTLDRKVTKKRVHVSP